MYNSKYSDGDYQREVGRFVKNNVTECQSMLVDHLLSTGVFEYEDITNCWFYRVDLSDGEEYFNTWEQVEEKKAEVEERKDRLEDIVNELEERLELSEDEGAILILTNSIETLQKALESCGDDLFTLDRAESEPKEIYEWWLVRRDFLDDLEEKGEPVLRTDYGDWWGRCTTGQAILLDSVICNLYDEFKERYKL